MGNTFVKTGRIFYGICIAALGVQQFVYMELRPVIGPPWPAPIPAQSILVSLVSLALIAAGAAIIFGKKLRITALILGGALLALVVLWQVSYMLFVNPYSQYLGTWTDPLKELALCGGAFVIAGAVSSKEESIDNRSSLVSILEKLIPAGKIFFSIMLIAFGIAHFLYIDNVATLVPAWIPGHIFWTYFAGVALIGSGAAMILNFKLKLVAILTSVMIFLWFLVLHIPRAIADPYDRQGNEITSVFEALGFSGIALVIAYSARSYQRNKKNAGKMAEEKVVY